MYYARKHNIKFYRNRQLYNSGNQLLIMPNAALLGTHAQPS